MRQPHALEHIRRLGELDVVIADDLDAVAPGIEEIQEPAGQRLDAGLRERLADRVLVIDHEPEMTPVIGGLLAALLQREELIAKIDEGRGLALAAQLEVEQPTVEGQRLVDVADLERDMIEADGMALFLFLAWGPSDAPTRRSCGDVAGCGLDRDGRPRTCSEDWPGHLGRLREAPFEPGWQARGLPWLE